LKIKTKLENSLLDGAFDEEANANEFAAALAAWRKPDADDKENKVETADNGDDSEQTDNNNKKSVHFAAETKEKKSFLCGLGGAGAMWGVVEGVSVAEEGIGTDPLP